MAGRARGLAVLLWALAAIPVLAAALSGPPPPAAAAPGESCAQERHRMVAEQIRGRDVTDAAVLAAMEEVPRHLFVPADERADAYADHALPIGRGQTISQPYIVALMTQLLAVDRHARVLEIGTGSGYHAAVLSRVAGAVYTMEIVPSLGEEASGLLHRLGYANVHVRIGDGYKGWQEEAPFDAILLTAAPAQVPGPLLAQLKPGGRMVLPLGTVQQELLVLTKRPDGTVETKNVIPVRFVPMTGEAQDRR